MLGLWPCSPARLAQDTMRELRGQALRADAQAPGRRCARPGAGGKPSNRPGAGRDIGGAGRDGRGAGVNAYTGWHFTEAQHHGRDGWPLQKVEELPTGIKPILCEIGLHASKSALEALSYAPGPFVSRVRLEGTVVVGDDKACAPRRVRLAGPADASRELRLFAADCAEHVLPIFEKEYPGDDRPRKAIEAARRFADGEASPEEMWAAGAAAWAASDSGAYVAAAWAAARAAASDSGDAFGDARDAAWAARDAAAAAAVDRDAGAAELEWQEEALVRRLEDALREIG